MNKYVPGNCPVCGSPASEDAEFCKYCGCKLHPTPYTAKQNVNQYNQTRWGAYPYAPPRQKESKALSALVTVLGILMLLGSIAVTALFIHRNLNSADVRSAVDLSLKNLFARQDSFPDPSDVDAAVPTIQEETQPSRSYPRVSMEKICAVESSPSLEEEDIVHGPDHAIDNDMSTAWNEGIEGCGEGSFLSLYLEEDCVLRGLNIYSGFQRSDMLFEMNARPHEIELVFSDGSSEVFSLADVSGPQTIQLSKPRITDSVTLRVNTVYPGSDYEDLCITEIELF